MINDLGFDPDEWFENPLDSMPIATDKSKQITDEYAPSSIEQPDDSEMIRSKKKTTEPDSIHERMYQMAIQKHNPWKGGGSENFQGGSEERLQEFTPENDPYGGY